MNTVTPSIPLLAGQLTSLHQAILAQVPASAAKTFDRSVELVDRAGVLRQATSVGDQAPAFTLPAVDGRAVSLHGLLAEGPVVVVFYRGGWCPYCNLQLRALQAVMPQIEAAGGRLVAISPQTPDESLSTQQKAGLGFDVLSDVGSAVSRRYGLVHTVDGDTREVLRQFGNDLERINGTDTWELPVPATFVIDRNGKVVLAHAEADYRRRVEPVAVVTALQGIAKR